MLIAQQVRDRFWLMLTSIGLAALVAFQAIKVLVDAGVITSPLSAGADLQGPYQAAVVAILAAMTALFLYGRLRLVRSEMDLLRLKLELFSEESREAAEAADASDRDREFDRMLAERAAELRDESQADEQSRNGGNRPD